MRLNVNAMRGSEYPQLEADVLLDLVNTEISLTAEFSSLCDRLRIPRSTFEGWGDDDVGGLTLDQAQGLGIPTPVACQLVAKVNGMKKRVAEEGKFRSTSHEAARSRLRQLVLVMLRKDDELRLSPEVQLRYSMEPESWEWKWMVTDEVQRKVCQETGFADNVAEGLDLLRSCMALFPEDEEVRDAAHYLRHNIHVDCPLNVGDVVQDILLHGLDGQARQLHDVAAVGRTTLLLAGSHT